MLLQISATGVFAVHPSHLPAAQVSLPVQVPKALVTEHACDRPSSVKPSQSSSMLLQVSVAGVFAVHSTQLPSLQVSVPVQVPKRFVTVHARDSSSSISPSQSSSMLLQISAAGVFAEHLCQLPSLHVSMPLQVPNSFVIVQACSRSSSVKPSQSSSILLQISAVGIFPAHPTQLPSTHVSIPVQVPKLLVIVHGCDKFSSVKPSQSSSMLLQISAAGVFAVHPTQLACLHVSVPLQVPNSFVIVQACSRSSSVKPSQSLSLPSQTSSLGSPGVHAFSTPSTHFITSLKHSPLPQLIVSSVSMILLTQPDTGSQLSSVHGLLSLQLL
ncbi:MAG: hypothetical protein BWX66_00652 [Deltaproteobacteria bacterium ADurb.Bin058]|nr:MAG: hypothetical protein BWX66_00652 [Deltaproteobacteria bacterium ADurb.Bin058]